MTKFRKVISMWANTLYTFLFQLTCWLYIQENCLKKDTVSHWALYFLSLTIDTNDMIPEYLIEKLEKILLIQVLSNECGMGVNKNDRKELMIQIPSERQMSFSHQHLHCWRPPGHNHMYSYVYMYTHMFTSVQTHSPIQWLFFSSGSRNIYFLLQ